MNAVQDWLDGVRDRPPPPPNCRQCGRFIGPDGRLVEFEPDSHFGPERSEYECGRCYEGTGEVVPDIPIGPPA